MGRIRTIKPDFFKHYGLYQAEKETGLPLRIAFSGLWTCCDREGRFKWIPPQLKIDILPYDELDFSRVLDALTTRGFVVKYASNHEFFGHIPSWQKHQVINNRETKSFLPNPGENQSIDACLTREPHVDDALTTRAVGKGREGKGIYILPDWIPLEPWHGWIEVRKKKKAPLTARSQIIALGKLEKWKNEGYDLGAILDAATFGNWQGLYIPEGMKPVPRKFTPGDPSKPEDWIKAQFEVTQ